MSSRRSAQTSEVIRDHRVQQARCVVLWCPPCSKAHYFVRCICRAHKVCRKGLWYHAARRKGGVASAVLRMLAVWSMVSTVLKRPTVWSVVSAVLRGFAEKVRGIKQRAEKVAWCPPSSECSLCGPWCPPLWRCSGALSWWRCCGAPSCGEAGYMTVLWRCCEPSMW